MPESAKTDKPSEKADRIKHPYPWYCARFWQGMPLGVWGPLLARNRFAVHPVRWGMVFTTTFAATLNTALGGVQSGMFSRKIRETEITEPPVFILGHWRSGTTFLHELLSLDEQFGSPTSYQCYAPYHFLLTQSMMSSMGQWLLPKHRPNDNVALGWDRPQEDEFALCNMGVPSPYERMSFPNRGPVNQDYLNMDGLSNEELEQWTEGLNYFVRLLTFHYQKRIILKSPTHTGRIGILADLFPGARFVHLTRNPYQLYSSTCNLWRALDEAQGFQLPHHRDIPELVLSSFEKMYEGYEAQRKQVPPENLIEVRYEDLKSEPVELLTKIYDQLRIDGFANVKPKFDEYAASKKDFRTNRHQLDEETSKKVATRWQPYFERYGYEI